MYRGQFGEDRLLDALFGHKCTGYYVEVGASNGIDISNTWYFEQRGWTGVLVEPIPALAAACRDARPRSIVVNAAVVAPGTPASVPFSITPDWPDYSSLLLDQFQTARLLTLTGRHRIETITVTAKTLDRILEDAGAADIDFVTVDVEGHEWGVLQGFSPDRWRPHVIILERNRDWPDRRIMRWMHTCGYHYLRTTEVNDWFIRAEPRLWLEIKYRAWLMVALYVRLALRFTLRAIGVLDSSRALKARFLRFVQ